MQLQGIELEGERREAERASLIIQVGISVRMSQQSAPNKDI